jgi:hypothetical protein
MTDFTDETEPLQKGKPLILGVLGSRPDENQQEFLETILYPILHELERTPDELVLPAEGNTSIWLSDWADSLKIPTQLYEADWRRHKRRAKIFRDSRIQQESTHFLVFLNKRSAANETAAMRLARAGHTVFTVSYVDSSIEQLIIEQPSSESQSAHPTGRGSKRGTGTKPKQLRGRTSEGPGTQVQLIDLWAASRLPK